MTDLLFEWDEEKNKKNITKHGISFQAAVKVFNDENIFIDTDYRHSGSEDRYYAIGCVEHKLVIIYVSFTERGKIIRIISARKANREERELYYDSLL